MAQCGVTPWQNWQPCLPGSEAGPKWSCNAVLDCEQMGFFRVCIPLHCKHMRIDCSPAGAKMQVVRCQALEAFT